MSKNVLAHDRGEAPPRSRDRQQQRAEHEREHDPPGHQLPRAGRGQQHEVQRQEAVLDTGARAVTTSTSGASRFAADSTLSA